MAALNGTLEEWEEISPSRWARRNHPEDGIVSIEGGQFTTFEAYYAKRLKDEQPLTGPEQLAADVEELERAFTVPSVLRALVKDRFDVENRLRVLEGKSTITLAQFKAALVARIRNS